MTLPNRLGESHQDTGAGYPLGCPTADPASALVESLSSCLRSLVDGRARGRPTLLLLWARKLGPQAFAEAVVRAVIPILTLGLPCASYADEIMSSLAETESDVEDLLPPARATLGWSALLALLKAAEDCEATSSTPPIRLRLRTRYRRAQRRDRYYLEVDQVWLENLWRNGHRDLLTPTGIHVIRQDDPPGLGAPEATGDYCVYETARTLVESTTWRVRSDVLTAVTALDEESASLTKRDRAAIVTAQALHGREFRFRATLDFRGEIHLGSSALSPQGSDLMRALIQFSEGKPLGRGGIRHLALHGHRMFVGSYADADWKAALAWARHNQDRILATASDPKGTRWWRGAARPWECLAWCLEWARALAADKMERYVSAMPILVPHDDAKHMMDASGILPKSTAAVAPAVRVHPVHPASVLRDLLAKLEAGAVGGDEMAARWRRLCDAPGVAEATGLAVSRTLRGFGRWHAASRLPSKTCLTMPRPPACSPHPLSTRCA